MREQQVGFSYTRFVDSIWNSGQTRQALEEVQRVHLQLMGIGSAAGAVDITQDSLGIEYKRRHEFLHILFHAFLLEKQLTHNYKLAYQKWSIALSIIAQSTDFAESIQRALDIVIYKGLNIYTLSDPRIKSDKHACLLIDLLPENLDLTQKIEVLVQNSRWRDYLIQAIGRTQYLHQLLGQGRMSVSDYSFLSCRHHQFREMLQCVAQVEREIKGLNYETREQLYLYFATEILNLIIDFVDYLAVIPHDYQNDDDFIKKIKDAGQIIQLGVAREFGSEG